MKNKDSRRKCKQHNQSLKKLKNNLKSYQKFNEQLTGGKVTGGKVHNQLTIVTFKFRSTIPRRYQLMPHYGPIQKDSSAKQYGILAALIVSLLKYRFTVARKKKR
ncbi:hypothetical protein LOAG_12422 [Loa loa]|uniref:Uncharacterized protein n=1 Tax=Loa loa TaxID=7209 RepID=A0A1S0TLP3_LOALO|nr:hypothetical protein LOAG_12422 [Loa loa]EFO16085.1 hypothetical protein LOAG_12422 [Loa loa]